MNPSTTTSKSVAAQVMAVRALGEAIQALGTVPSGELYAHVMGHMSLAFYQSAIDLLVEAKLITNNHNLLTWIGPAKGAR